MVFDRGVDDPDSVPLALGHGGLVVISLASVRADHGTVDKTIASCRWSTAGPY